MDLNSFMEVARPVGILVIIVLAIIALIALIVVLVRAAGALKNVNTTVESVNKDLDQVMTDLSPALKKVDPLMDRVELTVDTVSLELLRVDGILEDVENVTGVAGNAAKTVDTISQAPTDAIVALFDRIKGFFGETGEQTKKRFVYPTGAKPGEED